MRCEELLNLNRFVQGGGTLIALGGAGTLPVEGGMVRQAFPAQGGFNSPASERGAKVVRPEHPIVYGYEELTHVFRGNGPIFDVPKPERSRIGLQFGTKKPEGEEEEEAAAKKKKDSGIEVEDLDAPAASAAVPKPKPEEKKEDKRL